MRQLRELPRGERLSYAAIAERLNAESKLTRDGRPWSAAGVFQVLQGRSTS